MNVKEKRMTLELRYVCDRESWAGWIATRTCEITRLSRADSLVGGHLIVNCEIVKLWDEVKVNVRKYKIESSILILMKIDVVWRWVWIEMLIWLSNYFGWTWNVMDCWKLVQLCFHYVLCMLFVCFGYVNLIYILGLVN